jgi:hypothetical protein
MKKITKMFLIMSLLVPPMVGAVTALGKELVLTSFDTQSADLQWRVVNDTVMGGRSNSDFRLEGGVLTFSGSTNTNGGGFASVRSSLMDFGLHGVSHLALRVRSDGRTYTLLLRAQNQRISYRMDFATPVGEWQEVVLPIALFQASWRGRKLNEPPLAAADIAELGVMIADGNDGEFNFEIDWIKARSSL